ncbi:Deubiquitinating protein VCIP135 [Cryptotermes secundus]|uniref:Deubiquitinating protein VCIP135 n=1 Tax=Cryptotermes secundus TaxID=105785 RepID=A0A2J7QS40_9NEOP|nr:deubiquitinating protein VCIP135 isoform X3 [Cryptotermes secundus]PNF31414.1 Deubiquitinating protein VCIP135 [Cryptotermes secundus]
MFAVSGTKMVPVLVATCPDDGCNAVLIFPSKDKIVDCHGCGQRHRASEVKDVRQMQEQALGVKNVLRSLLLATNANMKKSADLVKVNGLSNYHCKLLSPLLTYHGMDKNTQKAKPLSELTNKATFDCSVLSDRSFLISAEHLDILGYGRDQSGSLSYLAETLRRIEEANGDRKVLVPIHADADGHCLVHAVSRALVGRQLFWHPLRTHLKRHIREKKDTYKELLQDFINASEWDLIIEECDPDYVPEEAKGEILGLRNIHVFGLANIVKRPIILLDSAAGMNCSGDYSAVFLPALVNPEECKGKTKELNLPLCLAWSSSARNHFIPLVGIEGEKLPVIPRRLLPEVWGVPQNLLSVYMNFDDQDCIAIGGNKVLQQSYIRKLVKAMDELMLQKFGVRPSLVCDMYQYNYKKPSATPITPQLVTSNTQKAIQERRVFKCLSCYSLCVAPLSSEWLRPGNNGLFYNLAIKQYGTLEDKKVYTFANYGVSCSYDAKKDVLVLNKLPGVEKCSFCLDMKLRLVYADGTIAYENGDLTPTRAISSHCQCGYKHWWNGKEYDNPPDLIPVVMTWKGREATEIIAWFQYECDPSLNSNVFQVASYVVQKHFPGEFGSERLVQKVVTQILELSKCLDAMRKKSGSSASHLPALKIYHEDESNIHVPTRTDSKQQETGIKPKLTITSQEENESKIISCSEGPIAVQLQGNKDQSKKMAAMTPVETQPPMDTSADETKQGLPVAEKDKTKVINDARMQKAQIGLKEQQLEYKLRKEREYQNQLHRQARQLAKQTRPIQDPDSFHSTNPELAGMWNCGTYSVHAKSRGRGILFEEYNAVEEDIDDFQSDDSCGASFHCSGASASRTGDYTYPVDQAEKSSTKTVRVGPGYSVLASPKPSWSTTATSESQVTWAESYFQ